jgi:hypothetical protein
MHDWERGVLDEVERWNRLGDFSPRIFHAPQPATNTHHSFTIHTRSGLRGVLGVLVPTQHADAFRQHFRPFFDDRGILCLDNLIHLCMIVKDSGPQITSMLEANLAWIDRWTVLDTGSTDGTPQRIHGFMEKRGLLPFGSIHTKPFRDFAQSRNECLDIAAGSFACTTYLMMDDTYILHGDPLVVRQFVVSAINTHSPTSLSLLVRSGDVEYASNRITLNGINPPLRYIHPIHECLQHERNDRRVLIPGSVAFIHDRITTPMSERSRARWGDNDLGLLRRLVESEEPHDPRHAFYLAETLRALGRVEEAAQWYARRASWAEGYVQERVVSHLRLALIKEQGQGQGPGRSGADGSWEQDVEPHYMACIALDDKRPEAYFHMAMHHHRQGRALVAFSLLHRAFQVGYPTHCHFQLNPALSFVLVPFHLIAMCMAPWDQLDEPQTERFTEPHPTEPSHHLPPPPMDVDSRMDLALRALMCFKESRHEAVRRHPLRGQMRRWEEILVHVHESNKALPPKNVPVERTNHPHRWAMIVPGGKGDGHVPRGSPEDWAHRLATALALQGIELWIFCTRDDILIHHPERTPTSTSDSASPPAFACASASAPPQPAAFACAAASALPQPAAFACALPPPPPITLIPIQAMWTSLFMYNFHGVILSGNEAYLPALYRTNCNHIFLVLHQPIRSDTILVFGSKLRGIVPRSQWHSTQIRDTFQRSADLDAMILAPISHGTEPLLPPCPDPPIPAPCRSHAFIYVSQPEEHPSHASLHILLDMWPRILGIWPDASLEVYVPGVDLAEHRPLLERCAALRVCCYGGGDGGGEAGLQMLLQEGWQRAQYWLYPSTSPQAFSVSALDAAANRTLAVVPNLAVLTEVPGIVIEGDAKTLEWQDQALAALIDADNNPASTRTILEAAHCWATQNTHTWAEIAHRFLEVG